MRIEIIKHGKVFEAIRTSPAIPGTPIAGHGRTWKEALGDLIANTPWSFGIGESPHDIFAIQVLNEYGKPFRFRETKR